MLFNSYGFIFVFLPLSLSIYYLLGRMASRAAIAWIVVCSLVFYGWWNPRYLLLICGSIAFNYLVGKLIFSSRSARPPLARAALIAGVTGNLLLLFFYKYLVTLVTSIGLGHILPETWRGGLLLPLGISFFTFTQIGYLVDLADGVITDHNFLHYAYFVTFFPHLIAGPILHNQEIIPQIADKKTYQFDVSRISVGLVMFTIGLFKKVLLADTFALWVDQGFASPGTLSTATTWLTILGYTLQLYFDFSGYSDMAIGLARMFGVTFPLNFNSPYKAASIIDFWQRWHMTLTRYLNLLLYNPIALQITRRRFARGLKTSRKATQTLEGFSSMVVFPTAVTMILAGVWHGAGLQFLIFGLLHALYLVTNHAWRIFGKHHRAKDAPQTPITVAGSVLLTMACVIIAQIFFRAASTSDAVHLIASLAGQAGSAAGASALAADPLGLSRIAHHFHAAISQAALAQVSQWTLIAIGFAIVWGTPNAAQICASFRPSLSHLEAPGIRMLRWSPGILSGLVIGVLALVAIANLSNPTHFLYFQF
jgi:alginate O-acetyltransferase complex protein AlgI